MINVTRLNHLPLVLNADLIEYMEATPDTVITLTTGQKILIQETADVVINRVIEYRRLILSGMPGCPLQAGSTAATRTASVEEIDGE